MCVWNASHECRYRQMFGPVFGITAEHPSWKRSGPMLLHSEKLTVLSDWLQILGWIVYILWCLYQKCSKSKSLYWKGLGQQWSCRTKWKWGLYAFCPPELRVRAEKSSKQWSALCRPAVFLLSPWIGISLLIRYWIIVRPSLLLYSFFLPFWIWLQNHVPFLSPCFKWLHLIKKKKKQPWIKTQFGYLVSSIFVVDVFLRWSSGSFSCPCAQ